MAVPCVFCGQLKPSKEHVYPKWLRKVMGEYDRVVNVVETAEGRTVRPTQAAFDITVQAVCHDCNTGWMHDLEDAASPLLKPMIRGERRDLSVAQQRVLALWVCKTVLMMAQQAKSTSVVPLDHYRSAISAKLPPVGTSVWLATQTESLTGPVSAVSSFIDQLVSASPYPGIPVGTPLYSAGLAVGAFGALLLANARGTVPSPLPSPEAEQYVLPVWPPSRPGVWPPHSTDELGGFAAFYQRLFGSETGPAGVADL